MIIFACDPGKENMGFSVLGASKYGMRYLASGQLTQMISELKAPNIIPQVLLYVEELTGIFDKFTVTHLVMERFVSRGIRGSLAEYIGIMQGITLGLSVAINNAHLVTPSSWKNAFNRVHPLTELYKQRPASVSLHAIDASLIAMYYYQRIVNNGIPFSDFNSMPFRLRWLDCVFHNKKVLHLK